MAAALTLIGLAAGCGERDRSRDAREDREAAAERAMRTMERIAAEESEAWGVVLLDAGPAPEKVREALADLHSLANEDLDHLGERTPLTVLQGVSEAEASRLRDSLTSLGARADVVRVAAPEESGDAGG
ncbi:MAG: hypothetical protein VYC34_11635 [Planctomycetota bacterium]|nr:hypothetical protein [Planctomycetota bacterium]